MKSPSAADANTSVVIGSTSVSPKPSMKWDAASSGSSAPRNGIAITTPSRPSTPSITTRARVVCVRRISE